MYYFFSPILTHLTTTQYRLRLVASDNLNENHTTVVIHVKDCNDVQPVFDRPTYETQIMEEDDRLLPKRVLQVMFLGCLCVRSVRVSESLKELTLLN